MFCTIDDCLLCFTKSLNISFDLLISAIIVLILLTMLWPHSTCNCLMTLSSASSLSDSLLRRRSASSNEYAVMNSSRPFRQQNSLITWSICFSMSFIAIWRKASFYELSMYNAMNAGVYLNLFMKVWKD